MNKPNMNWKLIALGIIVIVIGIISYLPIEVPRIGIHPIDLFKIKPGYAIIALDIITLTTNFIANRKSTLPAPSH